MTGTTAAAVSIITVALTSNPAMGTTYDTGEDVVATLTFSRPVTFAEVGGNLPQLELDFGGTGKPATCAATNQQTAVVCTYTVVFGDTASAGVAIGANKLTLNGGTIRLGSGADANLDYTVPWRTRRWPPIPTTRSARRASSPPRRSLPSRSTAPASTAPSRPATR